MITELSQEEKEKLYKQNLEFLSNNDLNLIFSNICEHICYSFKDDLHEKLNTDNVQFKVFNPS